MFIFLCHQLEDNKTAEKEELKKLAYSTDNTPWTGNLRLSICALEHRSWSLAKLPEAYGSCSPEHMEGSMLPSLVLQVAVVFQTQRSIIASSSIWSFKLTIARWCQNLRDGGMTRALCVLKANKVRTMWPWTASSIRPTVPILTKEVGWQELYSNNWRTTFPTHLLKTVIDPTEINKHM